MYRLARKAAGDTTAFYSLKELHKRSGAKVPMRKFRQTIEEIVETAKTTPLPDYDLNLEDRGPRSGPAYAEAHRASLAKWISRRSPNFVKAPYFGPPDFDKNFRSRLASGICQKTALRSVNAVHPAKPYFDPKTPVELDALADAAEIDRSDERDEDNCDEGHAITAEIEAEGCREVGRASDSRTKASFAEPVVAHHMPRRQ
nr:replication initiator protein A [Rhizobium mongolense]